MSCMRYDIVLQGEAATRGGGAPDCCDSAVLTSATAVHGMNHTLPHASVAQRHSAGPQVIQESARDKPALAQAGFLFRSYLYLVLGPAGRLDWVQPS